MFKKIIHHFIRIIQRIIIVVSLIFVYFLGFGITLFFMMMFNRKVLTGYSKNNNTFWIKVKGYETDIEDSLRQS